MHEATHQPSIWLQRASAAPDHVASEQDMHRGPWASTPADRQNRLCICKGCSRLLTGRGLEGRGLEPEFEPSRPQAPAGDLHRAAQGICWLPRRESQATSQGSCTTTPYRALRVFLLPGRAWQVGRRRAFRTHPRSVLEREHDDSLSDEGHRFSGSLSMTSPAKYLPEMLGCNCDPPQGIIPCCPQRPTVVDPLDRSSQNLNSLLRSGL